MLLNRSTAPNALQSVDSLCPETQEGAGSACKVRSAFASWLSHMFLALQGFLVILCRPLVCCLKSVSHSPLGVLRPAMLLFEADGT